MCVSPPVLQITGLVVKTYRLVAGRGVVCQGAGFVCRHAARAFRCACPPIPPHIIFSTKKLLSAPRSSN